ncbi:MAG TPA: cytochrome oxidase subunit III [Planctomycetes bacterium]|nr:cytochrome oxidase subunit III [Planctomycetota bacterium]
MWLFLATEVLLFAGLFGAYTVYRYTHPEVFKYASQFLDTKWGFINTLVLLASSFTAALAVRAAQTKNRQLLIQMLAATILGACGFLVIKYIEYSHKFHEHILWGVRFDPDLGNPELHHRPDPRHHETAAAASEKPTLLSDATQLDYSVSKPGEDLVQQANVALPPTLAHPEQAAHKANTGEFDPSKIRNVHIFFGIYFCMTGLHGLHVVIGMIVLTWLLLRAVRGDFDEGYYLPVDLGALYWHLVDLIWIYLFPLLYLI